MSAHMSRQARALKYNTNFILAERTEKWKTVKFMYHVLNIHGSVG